SESVVIIEPVQGEGGVRIPPEGYLPAVAARCAEAGALLIVDEIQTGVGRLGRMWGVDSEGVVPDMLLSGKALGGGVFPVSAVVASTINSYGTVRFTPTAFYTESDLDWLRTAVEESAQALARRHP